jgi:hypothetical protein
MISDFIALAILCPSMIAVFIAKLYAINKETALINIKLIHLINSSPLLEIPPIYFSIS